MRQAHQFENPNAMTINLINTEQQLEDIEAKDKAETDEDKKKRIGLPLDLEGIEKLLKELDHEKSIEKMKEHEIDAELFWELSEADMVEKLDVTKVFGDKKRFNDKIKKIKKDHEDAKAEELKASKVVKTDGLKDILKKLATSEV